MKSSGQSSVGVTVHLGEIVKDMEVSFDDSTTIDDLAAAIGRNLDKDLSRATLMSERTGRLLERSAIASETDLLNGDTLVVSDGNEPAVRPVARLVHRGTASHLPDLDIGEGKTLVVGRTVGGPGTARLEDPTVSGRHAAIHWDKASGLAVEDLGSRNGTWVNDSRIAARHPLEDGDVVEFGDQSVFTVDFPHSAGIPSHLRRLDGYLQFSRPPRVRDEPAPVALKLDPAPEEPRRRRLPLPMIVSPVVLGVVMFLLLKSPTYLLFTAMGPVMALWNWIDGRTGAAREYREAARAYRDHLAEARATLARASRTRAAWMSDVFPGPPVVGKMCRAWSTRLWERRSGHPDYLEVRSGIGDVPSANMLDVPTGGQLDLVAEAIATRDGFSVERDVPVTIALGKHPVVGIVGGDPEALARWWVVQLAAQQSPRDMAMVFLAPEHTPEWEWAKWLPQVAESTTLGLVPMPAGPSEAKRAFETLRDLVKSRTDSAASRWRSDVVSNRSIVVIAEPPFDLKASDVSSMLGAAESVDAHVIWIAESEQLLPGECTLIVKDEGGTLSVTDVAGGDSRTVVAPDRLSGEEAAAIARRLAPIRDVTSTEGAAGLPATIGVLDVLGLQEPTADDVIEHWRSHQGDFVAPIGVVGSEILNLDLAATGDGAHGLVAGTTGAGKSEFLRSLVASLAYRYPPSYLTFLFVDYKGGAAFKDCVDLPHTVGLLTNLDTGLADRARRSLAAELDHRQRLFDRFGVKDLDQMRSKFPEDAPPYLLVIFDEFASLVAQIPEFVNGVVDIAQRGRSLGMHLILATQTPGGVINPKIQNCVNFRVAFRLREETESSDVIKSPDAKDIPSAIPGRGLLRAGDDSLSLFQAAYAGASSTASQVGPVVARTMIFDPRRSNAVISSGGGGVTDLSRIVEATREAFDVMGYPIPRRPWLPEMPAYVDLMSIDSPKADNGPAVAQVGIVDLPDRQLQRPYLIGISEVRNAMVLGAGASGKTTFLRTLTIDLAHRYPVDRVNVYGFDFASRGLRVLEQLPHVGGIASGDETSKVRNLCALLANTVESRRSSVPGDRMRSEVIVLVDGLVPLLSTLETLDGGQLFSDFMQLVVDGPPSGVHFVLATDQPQRVPSMIANSVGERLVLRLANQEAFATAGVDAVAASMLTTPGRGWSSHSAAVVQVAVVGSGGVADEEAQTEAIRSLASTMDRSVSAPPLRVLPDKVLPSEVGMPTAPEGAVVLGVDDTGMVPQVVDFSRSPALLVMGPPMSGKSTTLRWVHESMKNSSSGLETYYVSRSRTSLSDDSAWSGRAVGMVEGAALLEKVEERANGERWVLVLIDDADEFSEVPIGAPREQQQLFERFSGPLERMIRDARSRRVAVVAAGRFASISRAQGWALLARREEQALMLATVGLGSMTTDPVFGARIPRRSDYRPTPGRGVLLRAGIGTFLQVVWPSSGATTP